MGKITPVIPPPPSQESPFLSFCKQLPSHAASWENLPVLSPSGPCWSPDEMLPGPRIASCGQLELPVSPVQLLVTPVLGPRLRCTRCVAAFPHRRPHCAPRQRRPRTPHRSRPHPHLPAPSSPRGRSPRAALRFGHAHIHGPFRCARRTPRTIHRTF